MPIYYIFANILFANIFKKLEQERKDFLAKHAHAGVKGESFCQYIIDSIIHVKNQSESDPTPSPVSL